MPRCRRPGTANHLHLFERSLPACSLSECMLDYWMYEEFWETCLQTRYMSRARISSIRAALDRWLQITLFACPLLFRRLNRHFNWLVSKALHSLSWFTICPIFLTLFLCSTIATLPFAHNGDFTYYILNWAGTCIGAASLESVVDMRAGCVCGSLGLVKMCLHIIVLKFFCYLPLLYVQTGM